MKLLLLLAIVVLAFGLSPEPLPTCSSPHFTTMDMPISINQIQTYNPNDFFRGYNLNFTLVGAPSFIIMREKFKLFKSQKLPQPGLKNFHMDHQFNRWGNKLVTLSENGNTTVVRWGTSDARDSVPQVTEQATVQSDPKIHCYDAVWLRASGLLLVDCAKQANFALQNVFLFVNATSQQVIAKQVVNDMYIAYTRMDRRKIYHYQEDGQQYLMRAYFADAVDPHHATNTYVEILLINDPFRPWTIKVMDRSFLHQDKLAITDFKIYLGDIYILDYHSGVISFDLTPSQNIIIKGRYRSSSGFRKMGIYSNNLANEVLLALANEHGIYQIDWTDQIRPVIVAKYSLMEGSWLTSLWVNEGYIAAHTIANATTADNKTELYHSTFIFDRGTRTYMNAYAVIKHSSYRAAVDMNIQHNALLSIDEDSIDTYFLDQPLMFIYPTNSADEGKPFKFTVSALSINQYTGANVTCLFDMKFTVVPVDSMLLWPTGLPVPEQYYANYPGELAIPLDRYVIGANITYGVQQKVDNSSWPLPNHWIYQQNDTVIHWEKEPSFFKITFLRKEQFEFMGQQFLFIYTQDYVNSTHITQCRTAMFSKEINCSQDSHQPHINHRIMNLTATVFKPNYGDFLHIAAVTYDDYPNQIFIYNIRQRDMFAKPIMLGPDWEGRIQSIEFLGHYLAVVLRHVKTIVFYDMKRCADHQEQVCEEVFRINSTTMDRVGVRYFSPLQVYTSDFHPFVLFIQNVDSVIILDITRMGPLLLDVIQSPGSKQPGFWKWRMAITKGHLIIINPPNIIEEFSLIELYTRKITHMTKSYPLYNYTIPDKFDCDFSDYGDLLYITAQDKNLPAQKNSVVLVYRSAGPAVNSFYDVFHVEGKYEDMLIDVTGVFADYVAITMGSILMIFRQYQIPILIFQDNWDDFQFNITYTNDPQHGYHYRSHSKVSIANYPQGIIVNDSRLNQTDFLTNQVKYEKKHQQFVFDDDTWFNGSILNYTVEGCSQCGSKIKVVNHLQTKRHFFSETNMEDYVFTHEGGVVQQFQSLIKMRHNGSIEQIAQFPSVLGGEYCQTIKHSWIYDFTLSACQQNGEIYLYTTTFTSFKPFVNGPFYSGAKYVQNMQIMEDILIIVDVDENPWQLNRAGGIIVYAMNHDPFDPEMFDEIEIIQTDDLEHAVNWVGGPAFIGNAQLLFTNDTSLYRLVITQVRHGLFFVDFKWSRGRKSIQIVKVQFVDLNKLMNNQSIHMPNLAFFEAVAVTYQYFDNIHKYWGLQLVVTTRAFHTLKFQFFIQPSGTILDKKLTKVFYRYGYYNVANYIKTFDGYFAVVHNLPPAFQIFSDMNRKVLTLYDTHERWVFDKSDNQTPKGFNGTTIPGTWMHSGMGFHQGRLGYDFNFTLVRNNSDPFRDIGLLVIHDRQAIIREVAIHDHITIVTEQGITSDQDAVFKANSDFAHTGVPLKVIAGSGLSAGAIVAIVIGCVLVAVGGGYLVYRWNLKRKQKIGKELEDSLIDRDTLVKKDEQSDEDEDEDEQGQQQEDDQEEQEEQVVEQKAKPSQLGTQISQGTNVINGSEVVTGSEVTTGSAVVEQKPQGAAETKQ